MICIIEMLVTVDPGYNQRQWKDSGVSYNYTCDKQVLWESAGAFSARQLSDFTRQLARFTRSWSSGKMLAFQPRGFVFEPVGMR